jgi:hypothetical protein
MMKKFLAVLLTVCMLAGVGTVGAAAYDAAPGFNTEAQAVTGVTWASGFRWFATIDEAALDWALTFVPRTLEQDAEFGAIIFRSFNWRTFRWGYSYSQTIRGVTYAVMPLPPVWLLLFPFMAAGSVHTHPYGSDSYFSQQDINSAHFWALIAHYSYVAGPCGSVRKYDARTQTFELIHDASDPKRVMQTIAEYNQTHGGTGELTATMTGVREVTITGEVTGATEMLWFFREPGVSIILNASIEACPDNPPWTLIFDSRRGGRLEVAGGTLRSSAAVINARRCYHMLTISGGALHGELWARTVVMTGGVADIVACYWYTSEKSMFIETLSVHEGATLRITLNDVPAGTNPDDLFIGIMVTYISPQADVETNFPMNDTIWANADFTEFAVPARAWISMDFRIGPGQTLTVEENAAMYILSQHLILDGGTLALNGALVLMSEESPFLYSGEFIIRSGTIAGTNAGDLAGIYEPPSIAPPWFERLPRWLDFILRYYAFGWWWYWLV